jgi:hypothetical protein
MMFRVIAVCFEIVGWVLIALSPSIIGGILGGIVFLWLDSELGIVLGIMIFSLGVIIGVLWATYVFKSKNGTIHFMSRVMATPELDKKEVEEEK